MMLMKTIHYLTNVRSRLKISKFLLTATAVVAVQAASLAAETEAGFTNLFDGSTLNGWIRLDTRGADYFVTNGVIVCPENSGGDLLTKQEYSDFLLRLEYKLETGGKNGGAIRGPHSTNKLTDLGGGIQMLDDKAPKHANIQPWQFNGSIYGIVPARNGTPKVGDWNTEEITCVGRHYKIVLNDQVIVDADLNEVNDPEVLKTHPGMLRDRGHLGFLGHWSRTEFRNIRIKELPLEAKDNTAPKGFVAVFNGEDLSGWKGLVEGPPKRAKMSAEELAAAQTKADQRMREHWKAEGGEIVF